MTTTLIPQSLAATTPIKFTKPEQERLHASQRELERLDAKLLEVIDLKPTIAKIGEDFAAGKIELVYAAAILTASSEDRHALQQTLKPPVKAAMREAVASVGDLIAKARQHHLDELQKLASAIEKTERETQGLLGVSPEDFTASHALVALQEQFRRSRSTINYPPSRAELSALLAV